MSIIYLPGWLPLMSNPFLQDVSLEYFLTGVVPSCDITLWYRLAALWVVFWLASWLHAGIWEILQAQSICCRSKFYICLTCIYLWQHFRPVIAVMHFNSFVFHILLLGTTVFWWLRWVLLLVLRLMWAIVNVRRVTWQNCFSDQEKLLIVGM